MVMMMFMMMFMNLDGPDYHDHGHDDDVHSPVSLTHRAISWPCWSVRVGIPVIPLLEVGFSDS